MRPHIVVLLVGVVSTALSVLCSATDIVWALMGQPSEQYPELFVIAFALPPSLLLLLIGIGMTLAARRRQEG